MNRVKGCLWGLVFAWRQIAKIQLLLIGVTLAFGWLAGWDEPSKFAWALMWVGVGAIAFGAYSLMGGYNATRGTYYQYFSSAGPDSISDNLAKSGQYNAQSFSCFVLAGLAGFLTVVLSMIALYIIDFA